MCLALKQWSCSCFEKLSSCFCREWDYITHPKRKWGFLEGLCFKEGKGTAGLNTFGWLGWLSMHQAFAV